MYYPYHPCLHHVLPFLLHPFLCLYNMVTTLVGSGTTISLWDCIGLRVRCLFGIRTKISIGNDGGLFVDGLQCTHCFAHAWISIFILSAAMKCSTWYHYQLRPTQLLFIQIRLYSLLEERILRYISLLMTTERKWVCHCGDNYRFVKVSAWVYLSVVVQIEDRLALQLSIQQCLLISCSSHPHVHTWEKMAVISSHAST